MVIQRIGDEDAKKLVDDFRKKMPDGPGNLSEKGISEEFLESIKSIGKLEQSEKEVDALELLDIRNKLSESIPVEARKRFNQAAKLWQSIEEYNPLIDTVGDTMYNLHRGYAQERPVKEEINFNKKDRTITKYKEENLEAAKELRALAEIILFDFARKKTGGGSCDHYSAGIFLKAVKKYPEAKISIARYQPPESESGHKITPPSGNSFHRVVIIEEGGSKHLLDPWWPNGKSVEITEKNKGEYLGLQTIIEWNPKHEEFKAALRSELEKQYKELGGEPPQESGDSVSAVWFVNKI